MAFQIADVIQPLPSAGRIIGRGHRIVLDDDNHYSQHKASGRKVPRYKKADVFVMPVRLLPPTVENQKAEEKNAKKAAVLGELGFAQQED